MNNCTLLIQLLIFISEFERELHDIRDVKLPEYREKIQDAYKDSRFNKEIDKHTGYKTYNLLCSNLGLSSDYKVVENNA